MLKYPRSEKENRPLNGKYSGNFIPRQGFSIMEVLVTLVISSVVIGIISINFPTLKKISDRFIHQTLFTKQYYIFLLMLEEEYQQAELMALSDLKNLDILNFRRDINLDKDYLDSGENIAYRWNKGARRIDRKSGKSNYQALLEGISDFSWGRTGTQPVCHDLVVLDSFSLREKRTRFCRNERF